MKKEFSKSWKSSRQTRKQRKYRFNAHHKIKQELLSSNLSKELRKKHNRRSFTLIKGDQVKVLRGKHQGKSGKVDLIDFRKMKIMIEGLQITKKDGTKINVKIDPSKVQIQELNLEDKKRIESLNKTIKKTTGEK
jgi:large subunit ribosomal protein L24